MNITLVMNPRDLPLGTIIHTVKNHYTIKAYMTEERREDEIRSGWNLVRLYKYSVKKEEYRDKNTSNIFLSYKHIHEHNFYICDDYKRVRRDGYTPKKAWEAYVLRMKPSDFRKTALAGAYSGDEELKNRLKS